MTGPILAVTYTVSGLFPLSQSVIVYTIVLNTIVFYCLDVVYFNLILI